MTRPRGRCTSGWPAACPTSSPPQRNLFDLYHEIHGDAVPGLPALLPEVWLHWDPKTARERGSEALLRFRMDFLLLLPHGQRVVLEVDGSHHYASPDGNGRTPPGTPTACAATGTSSSPGTRYSASAPPSSRTGNRPATCSRQFFADLFRRFGVAPHGPGED